MSIKPSVGRVVWFHPSATDPININGSGPLAALIAYVHSDSMVNLAVFDGNGDAQSRTSVTLIQEGEDRPVGLFCEWMPFQKGQAAKTEAVETKLAQVTDAGVEQTAAWIGEAQARAQRLFDSFTSMTRARELVAAEVARTREKLGLPALPADADLWAPAGYVAA